MSWLLCFIGLHDWGIQELEVRTFNGYSRYFVFCNRCDKHSVKRTVLR